MKIFQFPKGTTKQFFNETIGFSFYDEDDLDFTDIEVESVIIIPKKGKFFYGIWRFSSWQTARYPKLRGKQKLKGGNMISESHNKLNAINFIVSRETKLGKLLL